MNGIIQQMKKKQKTKKVFLIIELLNFVVAINYDGNNFKDIGS